MTRERTVGPYRLRKLGLKGGRTFYALDRRNALQRTWELSVAFRWNRSWFGFYKSPIGSGWSLDLPCMTMHYFTPKRHNAVITPRTGH